VIDVSFISLKLIVGPAINILRDGGVLIALIKPQFGAGRGEVGKGGVIKDEAMHAEIVEIILSYLNSLNLKVKGVIPSPIEGADGNKEFLVCALKE
jgi:23S rRNA (cytidine1920-2'-O)/16S rRNA (cytidine1409-2'-O)-methyltransferase